MNQDPQPPLDYRLPRDPGDSHPHFFTGLIIGTIASAIAWSIFWLSPNGANSDWGALVFLIPALKLIIGIVCLFKPDRRAFAGGLLASIAVGFLIFFGLCAANFDKLKI